MKITIIGAGSVRFSLQLIGDIAKTENLAGSLVSLMDINEEKLEAIYVLAQKYVEDLGASLKLEKTMDMSQALEGTDFVIHSAAPSYPDRYDLITQIGEKHGYYRGIDSQEFNMVSTYSYILCSYPDLKLSSEIAELMEKLSPQAYLLQTANPVFEATQFVSQSTGVKVIGFCHGFSGVFGAFHTLGLNPEEVDWQVAGVNHGIWLNRFLYRGENAYPLLDKWIEEESQHWQPENPWDVQLSPAVIDMYKFYGMLPIGDTCRNGSWKYNYNLETKKKWYGKFGGIDNEVERPRFYEELRQRKRMMIELSKDPGIKLTKSWPEEFSKDKMSGEQQIPFINAIVNNKATRLVLNILNRGAIKGISDDVVVEIPLEVNGSGIHSEKIEPNLPDRILKYYLTPRITRMEMAVDAFTTGDRKILEELLVRDPRTENYEDIPKLWNEIFSLPFNQEMKSHYSGAKI